MSTSTWLVDGLSCSVRNTYRNSREKHETSAIQTFHITCMVPRSITLVVLYQNSWASWRLQNHNSSKLYEPNRDHQDKLTVILYRHPSYCTVRYTAKDDTSGYRTARQRWLLSANGGNKHHLDHNLLSYSCITYYTSIRMDPRVLIPFVGFYGYRSNYGIAVMNFVPYGSHGGEMQVPRVLQRSSQKRVLDYRIHKSCGKR